MKYAALIDSIQFLYDQNTGRPHIDYQQAREIITKIVESEVAESLFMSGIDEIDSIDSRSTELFNRAKVGDKRARFLLDNMEEVYKNHVANIRSKIDQLNETTSTNGPSPSRNPSFR